MATPALSLVRIVNPRGLNLILGQSHFIKTVEDVAEVCAQSHPLAKFGVAFCEASGDRLIRHDGNSEELEQLAVDNAKSIAAGHTFIAFLEHVYPVALLPAIQQLPETCRIFCATANPTTVIVASAGEGTEVQRGIMGVLDGHTPVGVEDEEKRRERVQFLRQTGYKRG